MDGWDPLREHLCEYVRRQRVEQQMQDYDDRVERTLEQGKALGLCWTPRPEPDPNQMTLDLTVQDNPEAVGYTPPQPTGVTA